MEKRKNKFFEKIKEHIMPRDVVLVLGLAILIFGWWFSSRPPSEEFIKDRQELNKIRNHITEEFLSQCKVETARCNFNVEEANLYELAEYIRNAEPSHSTGHSFPYASIIFSQENKDESFEIYISLFDLFDVKGVAILTCYLYKNGKCAALESFSSSELTEWTRMYFPEIFEKIKKKNENHFYVDK